MSTNFLVHSVCVDWEDIFWCELETGDGWRVETSYLGKDWEGMYSKLDVFLKQDDEDKGENWLIDKTKYGSAITHNLLIPVDILTNGGYND